MATASRILGDQVGSTAPAFLAFLAVHVIAGLAAVITGAIAALTRKGSPRHVRAGGILGRFHCHPRVTCRRPAPGRARSPRTPP